MDRLPKPDPERCPCRIIFAGIDLSVHRCQKKKNHLSKHRIEPPIAYTGGSGMTVSIDRAIEWEET